ncbi:MAG: asparagine synthase (glutamine-hydrolyzing) [Nitrospinae bacterium]|nr:asparagine synthase (glutamine-hydrolyzing) [Nitrospinota bacterium]
MCGVAGFLFTHRETNDPRGVVSRMAENLRHRGPDDGGSWVDEAAGVALGHRRLAVIDLSADGRQPMISHEGRYLLSYNGEIYNFIELRDELTREGVRFQGCSDTEVLLAAVERWGLDAAIRRSVGMFSFALWDRTEKTLHLARDRMGEKPLYYGWRGKSFLFGSELKALRAHPDWEGDINADALADYMKLGYVPTPHSIYRGIYKLPPASILSLYTSDPPGHLPEPRAYWRAEDLVEHASAEKRAFSEDGALDQLEETLKRSVRQMLHSDAPLGAFLSGGVDSSTVVALMKAESGAPVQTFSIGFHEKGYDETHHAREMARHLETEHTELYAGPGEALEVIPRLPRLYDEPFADPSQIPTHLLCALTRKHVTVALSGDGGDELFGGYNRYFWAPKIWRWSNRLPERVKKRIAKGLVTRHPALARYYEKIFSLLPKRYQVKMAGEKLLKLADLLGAASLDETYQRLRTQGDASVCLHTQRDMESAFALEPVPSAFHPAEWMMYRDMVEYLPDDILVKVDRAGMGASLEVRAPYLDHRVVEFVWSLPLRLKLRRGEGKWILRRLLSRYAPASLIQRPKMGFAVPVGEWLRGPLKDWAEDLLTESPLREEGFFRADSIRAMWGQHISGERDWQYCLWGVLMFQAWLDEQGR